MAYGVFHIFFRAEVLAPVLADVGPVKDSISWVFEDPGQAWIELAALVIPHIRLYFRSSSRTGSSVGASCSGPC